MSSFDRGPLQGVIRQENRIVGSIVIPDCSELFVDQFNTCYGPLQMRIEVIQPDINLHQANAKRVGMLPPRRPFWNGTKPKPTSGDSNRS